MPRMTANRRHAIGGRAAAASLGIALLVGVACTGGGDDAASSTPNADEATSSPTVAATEAPRAAGTGPAAPPINTSPLDLAPPGEPDPVLLEALARLVEDLPPLEGDTEREQIRSALGAPDAWELTFELVTVGPGEPAHRSETWFYYDLETAYAFNGGALVSNLPIEASEGLLLAAPQYDPDAFERSMTWDDVKTMLVDPDSAEVFDLESDLGEPLVGYVAEQLIAVFDPDGLVFVEAVALQGGGE